MRVYTQSQHPLTLGDQIGKGGEARILRVVDQPGWVAKIYHQPSGERAAKLRAMLANSPRQPRTHTAIAWPTDLVLDGQGQVLGFVMPNVQQSRPIFQLYNPTLRKQFPRPVDWRVLHRTALNFVLAVRSVHAKGHVIGDLNESNILVDSKALVTLVDTDSFQITASDGLIFRCGVGKSEYTAPELHGQDFRAVDQQVTHDLFSVAVLLFQLLMEGKHPFAGVLQSRMSVGRVDLYAIREGLFPYTNDRFIAPPPNAPPFTILHPELQAAFQRAFVEGHTDPSARPTLQAWEQTLRNAEQTLVVCEDNPQHVFSNHVTRCPWCALERHQTRATRTVELIESPRLRVVSQAPRPKAVQSHPFVPIMTTEATPPPPVRQMGRWVGVGLTSLGLMALGTSGMWLFQADINNLTAFSPTATPTATQPAPIVNQPTEPPLLPTPTVGPQRIWLDQIGVTSDLAASPDGRFFVGASIDSVWLYDRVLGQLAFRVDSDAPLNAVAVSPDGAWLVAGGAEGQLLLWDTENYDRPKPLIGHQQSVTDVAFSPDSQWVLSSSADNTIRWWRVGDGSLRQPLVGHGAAVTSIALSPDGQTIVSGSMDNTVRLWRSQSGRWVQQSELSVGQNWVTAVALSPNSAWVAAADTSHTITLWSISQTSPLTRTLRGHTSDITSLTFTPDSTHLLSGSTDGTIRLWQINEAAQLDQWYDSQAIRRILFVNGEPVVLGDQSVVYELYALTTP